MFLKKSLSILLLAIFIMPMTIFAYSDYIIPGGENIGIEVKTNGVLVVGIYEIDGKFPATESGIKIGDIITKVDNKSISSISELGSFLNKLELPISYIRNNKEYNTTLKLVNVNGEFKTGLYVKDTITGVGTLSFIDPNTHLYGALGHEIIESSTGVMLETNNGSIFESNVLNIERSENGNPGSKIADLKLENKKGTIFENTTKGIFGKYTSDLPNKKQFKVAQPNEIKIGPAKIYTVLNGNEIKEYSINIIKTNKNDTKNILFEITDDELLNRTGGIIQGMSGSPIIQGEYIIGAVTHVVVDNPSKGYGIFITKMLEEAEN